MTFITVTKKNPLQNCRRACLVILSTVGDSSTCGLHYPSYTCWITRMPETYTDPGSPFLVKTFSVTSQNDGITGLRKARVSSSSPTVTHTNRYTVFCEPGARQDRTAAGTSLYNNNRAYRWSIERTEHSINKTIQKE